VLTFPEAFTPEDVRAAVRTARWSAQPFSPEITVDRGWLHVLAKLESADWGKAILDAQDDASELDACGVSTF
jgi:hypothetical protein